MVCRRGLVADTRRREMYSHSMHLLCRDTQCAGNALPAGGAADETCRFCEAPLADGDGNVLACGVGPLVDGEPPATFDQLMDALREAGVDVQVVELSTVRVGERLLVSALNEDGALVSASVVEGAHAETVERVMAHLEDA